MGFDPAVAKMAVSMAYSHTSPDVQYLKSAGANAMQAAKALFESDLTPGQIVDELLEMGFSVEEASEAIDSINLDAGDQEVNDFTEEDVEFKDDNSQIDEAYQYDDIPPDALRGLLNYVEDDNTLSSDELEEFLDQYDVSSESVSQLINELGLSRSASSKIAPRVRGKFSTVAEWEDLARILKDKGQDNDQIRRTLTESGASEDDATAAIAGLAPSEEYPEGEQLGAPSDAPEDLDLGASGEGLNPVGMDLDGPGGLNDSLEGAPGPNDFSGTGGGYIAAPDDTADGDFFSEAPSGSGGDFSEGTGSEEEGSYLEDMANKYRASDPQMTKDDLVAMLENNGADKQEANQVADKLNVGDDPAIKPGVFVRAGVGTGRVTSVWDTMYGKMANVLLDNDGKEYEILVEDIQYAGELKTAADERDVLAKKIAAHLSGDWHDSLNTVSSDFRATYSRRIQEAKALMSEVNNRLAVTKDIGEMGLLTDARTSITNEINFCQTRIANAEFVGEDEYIDSLPSYEFGKEAALGNGFGPGGGESMVLVADDMEEHLASIDWDEFTRTASVDFVSEVSPIVLGDAQEVARLATTFIQPKVSVLPSEQAREIASEFMANVERARRVTAFELKTSGDPKETIKKEIARKMRQFREAEIMDSQDGFEWDNAHWDNKISELKEDILMLLEDEFDVPLRTIQDAEAYVPGISEMVNSEIAAEKGAYGSELGRMINESDDPDSLIDRFASKEERFFDVVEDLDDMQDEVKSEDDKAYEEWLRSGEFEDITDKVKEMFEKSKKSNHDHSDFEVPYDPNLMTDDEIYHYWRDIAGLEDDEAHDMLKMERAALEDDEELSWQHGVQPGAHKKQPGLDEADNKRFEDKSDEGWLL
jgi:signal transduction histidine kinase